MPSHLVKPYRIIIAFIISLGNVSGFLQLTDSIPSSVAYSSLKGANCFCGRAIPDVRTLQMTSDDNEDTLVDKINTFLDTPFFDPENVVDDGTPMGRFKSWFASIVQNDYEYAETLYAGGFLAFMVWISQELLRMQVYGDNYVPFKPGGHLGGF